MIIWRLKPQNLQTRYFTPRGLATFHLTCLSFAWWTFLMIHSYVFALHIILPNRYCTGNWNSFSWKLRICPKNVVNIRAADPIPRNILAVAYWVYIDGLVQDCSNSSALVMELLQSCTKPLTCAWVFGPQRVKLRWYVMDVIGLNWCSGNTNLVIHGQSNSISASGLVLSRVLKSLSLLADAN